ncbi:MAG: hypothetical protein EAZ32_03360 [Cytophagia bacterium]|nr:MAG: hypothetical protein EAZ38_06155 [Cytophagales bacterium]TAG41391.1 MAG: hypothetical protein EAZ32_03360 [Cytophagia bacterium]TAG52248.1 MAG: hypothetical protein EAZ29_07970 [Runella slithyformis]TAG61787.1 MAG: hypothetical protein EAZ26_12880 [Runella slithyformis]TAG83149.1 MAG: hypothetical protein EAZ22_03730 [Cytophagales bacterium]
MKKLLLDENLPRKLKFRLIELQFEAYTVSDKNWQGKKNGDLLRSMIADGFDVLLTVDKNLAHQQNFDKYPIAVLVVDTHDNSYQSLMEFMPQINDALSTKLPEGLTLLQKQ